MEKAPLLESIWEYILYFNNKMSNILMFHTTIMKFDFVASRDISQELKKFDL